jgi:hypothetical protein
MRTWLPRILAINLVIGAFWFGWPFLRSAETQVLNQHRQLLDRAAHQNWLKVFALMAEDYRDGWDMNREEAVSLGRELFQGFLMLELQWRPTSVVLEGKTATVTGFIKAGGTGAGLSQEIIGRLNRLQSPFVFSWRKDGWRPGDWRLVSVNQAELDIR